MKILLIGVDAIEPALLFGDDRLINLRRLMEFGCYGRVEGVSPPGSQTAWLCLATSRDPQNLGAYNPPGPSGPDPQPVAIWDHLTSLNKRSLLIGVPLARPPAWIHGLAFQGLMNPAGAMTREDDLTDNWSDSAAEILGNSPKMAPPLTSPEALAGWIDSIQSASHRQFSLARRILQTEEWDYLQIVDYGLGHILQALAGPLVQDNQEEIVSSFLQLLDVEIGEVLGLLQDDTIVAVVTPYGLAVDPAVTGQPHSVGGFILASANNPLAGEQADIRLWDLAPTLLELAGYPIPESMAGFSLVSGRPLTADPPPGLSAEDEAILRERLSGLGYID